MFKEIWLMYRKSIVSSLLALLAIVALIYTSSVKGNFLWFTPPFTGYAVLPSFSALAIVVSFLILLALFVALYMKSK